MPNRTKTRQGFNVVSSSAGPIIAGPWMLAAGTDHLRMMRSIKGTSGSTLTTQGAYQTADVLTDEPDAWVASGGTRTGNGYDTTDVDLSSVTDKLWIRAGIVASSTAQDDGSAELVAMTESKGRILAARQVNCGPTPGTTNHDIAISGPIPLVGLSKVMAALQVEHQGNNAYVYPTYRLLTNDPRAGGAWSTLSSPGLFSTSKTYNSGEVTVADDTTKCFIQFGLRWKSTTGSILVNALYAGIYE